MPKTFQESFHLTNENEECEIIAAGAADPVFGEARPDRFTAYSRVTFARSLPHVAGPEMISGSVFGIHPAVVARSAHGIVHKQMNMGHKVTYLGAKEDRICGCVLAASYPEEPEGGWEIPASAGEAPVITAFAALFKQAKGVDKMLGDHLSGKVRMAVSMEFSFFWEEAGIYVPDENKVYHRSEIPRALQGMVFEDEKGRLLIRKSARNPKLVLAIGGKDGRLVFSGVGYTANPADVTATVDAIAAERREGMMVCGAPDADVWTPGMPVAWVGGEHGRGTIACVHVEGRPSRHGKVLAASFANPALEITLPNGVRILRSASSVRKNFVGA
jgi:hypothetical protein